MAPKAVKRAVSAHNVDSKRTRMGKEVENLVEKERDLQWQQDMQWVTQELYAHPEKLSAIVAVLKCDVPTSYDPSTHISPDYLKRSFTRLPNKFLLDYFPSQGDFDTETFKKILKSDAKCLVKVLQRLCVLPNSLTIWSNEKATLCRAFSGRMKCLGTSLGMVSLQDGPAVDWAASGIFHLYPKYELDPEDAESAHNHIFNEIGCGDARASLSGFVVVRATWTIISNWSLQDASLVCPDHKDFAPKCLSFFKIPLMDNLMVEDKAGGLPLGPASDVKKQLCIEDKTSNDAEGSDTEQKANSATPEKATVVTPTKTKPSSSESPSPCSSQKTLWKPVGPPQVPSSKASHAQKRLRGKCAQ